MHNRDMTWSTADGRILKIRNITSRHLTNILHHIEKNRDAFEQKFGKKRVEKSKHNILQEIRYRKLNRLNNNEDELF